MAHSNLSQPRPWSASRSVGVAVGVTIAGLWVAMLLAELLPGHWLKWHVFLDIEAGACGVARVYFDDGDGISEAKSIDLKLHQGRQKLYFVLPATTLHGLRIDPIDRATGFTMHHLRLRGPCGSEVMARDRQGREKVVEISWKPDQAINAEVVNDRAARQDAVIDFVATSDDPHFYLRVKPSPLQFPRQAQWLASALLSAFSILLVTSAVVMLRRRPVLIEALVCYMAAAAVMMWVLAFYVLTVQRIDPVYAYRLVLPLLLLVPLTAWIQRGTIGVRWSSGMMASVAMCAWLAYFGARALAIGPGSVPSRVELMLAVAMLLALLGGGLALSPESWRRFLRSGFFIWLLVAVIAAVVILIKSYHPNWDLAYRAAYFDSPLFRPISGSACFGVGAVALVALSVKDKLSSALRVGLLLLLAVLCVYFLQAKSRAVVIGVVVAVIFVIALARSMQVLIAGGLALSLCAVFAFTPWPASIADALSGDSPVGIAGDEAEHYRVVGSIVRPATLRPVIYAAYFKASMERPLFGHGFAGEHAIIVESEELAKTRPDFVGQAWNPHNLHLSVLYFGGIVGVGLHAAMLGLPMWFGLRIFLKTRDPMLLALLGMVTFAGVGLLFESTMMNGAKHAVVFWYPNEYWLFFWGPLILLNVHLAKLSLDSRPQSGDAPSLSNGIEALK